MSALSNRMLRRALAMLTLAACSCVYAQFPLGPGKFESAPSPTSKTRIVVLVKPGSSNNFAVEGTIRTVDGGGKFREEIKFSGTLYKSGSLKARVTSPAKYASTWTLNGTYDTKTGKLHLAVKYPQKYDNQNRSGYYINNYILADPERKGEVETVWVLKPGFPKYDEAYERSSKPFTVDASGTMVWPSTSLKDGKPISQTLKFTPPKNEYKVGEKFTFNIDASGTEKGAYPYVMIAVYFGWLPGGQMLMGNDNSQFSIDVGFKLSKEVFFDPNVEANATILIGAPGLGGLRWEYHKVIRYKKN